MGNTTPASVSKDDTTQLSATNLFMSRLSEDAADLAPT